MLVVALTERPDLLLVATVAAAFGLAVYVQAFFFSKPDPQVGFVFIFVPLWQAAGVMLGVFRRSVDAGAAAMSPPSGNDGCPSGPASR